MYMYMYRHMRPAILLSSTIDSVDLANGLCGTNYLDHLAVAKQSTIDSCT